MKGHKMEKQLEDQADYISKQQAIILKLKEDIKAQTLDTAFKLQQFYHLTEELAACKAELEATQRSREYLLDLIVKLTEI